MPRFYKRGMGSFLPSDFVFLFRSRRRGVPAPGGRVRGRGGLPAGHPHPPRSLRGPRGSATNFRKRFVFLVAEPIIMEGSPEFKILKDKWTAISVDNKRCLILFFDLS